DQHAEIELALDVAAFLDIDAAHFLARAAGLFGHQHMAEHRLGDAPNLFGRLGDAHAAALALGPFELAFAAAARVDLRLHHPDRTVQVGRDMLGLGRRVGHAALEHAHAIAGEQLLGLILVDIHWP